MVSLVVASFITAIPPVAAHPTSEKEVIDSKTNNIYTEIYAEEPVSLEGVVRLTTKNRYLVVQNKEYLMQTTDKLINKDLSTLNNKDFVAIQGILLKDKGRVEVTQIHYVGVSQILGKWVSDTNEVYDFISFFKLNRQKPEDKNFKSYSYLLVPESDMRWTLFLSNSDNTHSTGYIELKDNVLEFVVFNSSDGSIYEKTVLKPYKKEEAPFNQNTR